MDARPIPERGGIRTFRRTILVLLALATTALLLPAGAAPHAAATRSTGTATCDPAPDLADPIVTGPGHDHTVNTQHQFATSNLALVAYSNPQQFANVPEKLPDTIDPAMSYLDHSLGGGQWGETDVFKDATSTKVVIARISAPQGFWVYDVSDPAHPVELVKWRVSTSSVGGYTTDVKFSADGNYVYAAYQAGGGAVNGLHVVDIRNPTLPVPEQFIKIANGVHMVTTHTIDGIEFVFANTAYGDGIYVYAAGLAASPVKYLVAAGANANAIPGITAHDSWVSDDPILAKPILHVAAPYFGYRAYDVSVPAKPVALGTWSGDTSLYWHTARSTVLDGHRYVILSPEYFFGAGARVGELYILDATDYSHIQLVGNWATPGNHAAGDLVFSTHNFQIVDGRLYLAHYHAGVWVLDVSDATKMANPVTLGYYLPAVHTVGSSSGYWAVERMIPSTWDVTLLNGDMMLGDITGGLYVVHFACDAEGPSGPTSVG